MANELTHGFNKENVNSLFGQSVNDAYVTSVDLSTEEGRFTLLALSQNEPDYKLSDFIGKQITFSDFYMEKVQIEDSVKKGKVVDSIRTVLMTPDGDIIQGTSEGLAKSVMMIVNCLGMPRDWDSEYWFEVKQVETRLGRRYFKLQLARGTDGRDFD